MCSDDQLYCVPKGKILTRQYGDAPSICAEQLRPVATEAKLNQQCGSPYGLQ